MTPPNYSDSVAVAPPQINGLAKSQRYLERIAAAYFGLGAQVHEARVGGFNAHRA
jgi:hypothetical protein